ncbi:hypothetical protein COV18_02295 [Candidatus Woesearchaeota archaeon CG10_big_fil_rev_8_21_14_0_10_37_12]|nr:MAG: hypothetical protein COV18_02295 [Candidatus Woesearchaeota archaeon CG10_big_fil_rev_8_21_14_0_10_37_12]
MTEEFQQEFDDYLSSRQRAKPNFIQLFKQLIPKPNFSFKRETSETVVEPEIKQESETQQNFKDIFFNLFKRETKKIEHDEIKTNNFALNNIKQDMKQVSKIVLSAVKQLPPEQLREFKNSREFQEMKEILKKNELIK